jgi:hypothetical protein
MRQRTADSDLIIAQRTLQCREDPTLAINVTLFMPRLQETSGAHACDYQLKGRGVDITRSAFGIDAFQALQSAMVMIGSEVASLEKRASIHFVFSDLKNSGFPRP